MNVSGIAAASTNERFAGFGRTFRAGTASFSAIPPETCSPRIAKRRQRFSLPERQRSQRPQPRLGFTTTASPTFMPSTPGPIASMTPATSDPSTCGKASFSPGQPMRTQMSRWFCAAALTATTTCARPRRRIGQLDEVHRLGTAVRADRDRLHLVLEGVRGTAALPASGWRRSSSRPDYRSRWRPGRSA